MSEILSEVTKLKSELEMQIAFKQEVLAVLVVLARLEQSLIAEEEEGVAVVKRELSAMGMYW